MLAIGIAAVLCLGVWLATAPRPQSVRQRAETQAKERRRRTRRNDNLLLWLSGIAMPPAMLPVVQLIFAGAGAIVGYAMTHNVVIAGELGYVTWFAPTSLLKHIAARRWNKADDSAYMLCNVLRFNLALSGHPHQALRAALPDLDEPLKGWLSEAMAMEAAGRSVEDALYEIGLNLRHQEISLLAEILKADRRESSASHLLPGLLEAWTERVRASQRRRAKLSTAQMLSTIMIWGPVGLFLFLNAFTPVGNAFQGSFLGQLMAAIGFTIMVFGATIARKTLDKERGLPV